MDRINELIQERDQKLISKYCQEGTFVDAEGNVTKGVCKPVDLSEILNDLHLSDALIIDEVNKTT